MPALFLSPAVGSVKSALPDLPAGLVYKKEKLNGQDYVTTGAFLPGGKRTRADLKHAVCLIIDFDLVDWLARRDGWTEKGDELKVRMYRELAGVENSAKLLVAKDEHRASCMEVLAQVIADVPGTCPPTVAVDSGWGLHLYFWFRHESASTQIDLARAVNKELVSRINAAAGYDLADPGVHDTGTRILRPVGSLNIQAARYAGIDHPAEVVVVDELCHLDARWLLAKSAETFVAGAVKTPANPENRLAPGLSLSSPPVTGTGTLPAVDRRVMRALSWLKEKDKTLVAIYDAAVAAQNSNEDATLCAHLSIRKVSPALTAAILRVVRTDGKHDGTDYFERTAMRAWTFTHGDTAILAEDNYDMRHEDALMHFEPGMSCLRLVAAIAQHDPRISRMLWVDSRIRRVEWGTTQEAGEMIASFYASLKLEVPKLNGTRREFTDENAQHLCRWIEDVYGEKCLYLWREAISMVSSSLSKRNPVQEYLEVCGASTVDRDDDLLETWLINAFGLPDTKLTRVYSKKWVIGGVARAMNPGVFLKAMLVLVSPQSAGKSSMFRLLANGFYVAPAKADLSDKDVILACHRAWLVDMEEMDVLRANAVEVVKKYLTTQEDVVRLPYGRDSDTFLRPCFYGGNANKAAILSDSTGSDRFWCVQLPDEALCDFAYIRDIRERLWGQAYHAWMRAREMGESAKNYAINLTREELAMLREANVDFQREDEVAERVLDAAWTVAVDRAVGPILPLRLDLIDLLTALRPPPQDGAAGGHRGILESHDRATQNRVGDILSGAGWKKDQRRLPDGSRPRAWWAPEALNFQYTENLAMVQNPPDGKVAYLPIKPGAPVTVADKDGFLAQAIGPSRALSNTTK